MDEREPWIQALLHTVEGHAPAVPGETESQSEDDSLRALWPHEPDVIVLIDSSLMISTANAAGRALLVGNHVEPLRKHLRRAIEVEQRLFYGEARVAHPAKSLITLIAVSWNHH